MGLFKKSRPNFYHLMSAQAETVVMGVSDLGDFLCQPDENNAARVTSRGLEADEQRKIIIDELNKTFLTPIDREDIFALSRAIDDVMDYALSTVEEMTLLNVGTNPHLQKMAKILMGGMDQVHQAILRLEKNTLISYQHALEAKKAENDIEHIYRQALVDLFKGQDVIMMMKLREIYRHISNAADRCETAANIISDIVVKNA